MKYLVLTAFAGVFAIFVAQQVRPIVLETFGQIAAAQQYANRISHAR
jgi:hypothetical protein